MIRCFSLFVPPSVLASPSIAQSFHSRCIPAVTQRKKKVIKGCIFFNKALRGDDDDDGAVHVEDDDRDPRPFPLSSSSSSSSGQDEEYLASMASLSLSFRRRLGLGLSLSLAVALGGNLGGITSFLLGLNGGASRSLKLDVVYPVQGFKRCLEKDFEFVYPEAWVGDQRLLYRAIEKAERQRLYGVDKDDEGLGRRNGVIEPIVAYGPPGSTGELNVSVVVAPVPPNFSLDEIGDPKEVGQVILKSFITASSKLPSISPTLINAEKREDALPDGRQQLLYYQLEFAVKGPSFLRHNVSVYTAHNGKLFSLTAQTPEALWPQVKDKFFEMADSFRVI